MAITLVRNTQPGPTVFTDIKVGHVEWQGANDPNSLDIQPVPDEMLDNVQFQQAVVRGILVIEQDSDKSREIFESHKQEWEVRRDRQANAANEQLERPQDNDTVVLDCIGPKGKTGELCGEPVAVKSVKRFEEPALCPKHYSLKNQFVSEETERMVGGQREVVWTRAVLGKREREI